SFPSRLQFAVLDALEEHDRQDQQQQHRDSHGARVRPAAVVEELVIQLVAIMSWSVRPNNSGTTYSPTAGMNTSSEPARIPGIDSGSVMRRKARIGPAPRSDAASSSVLSCFSRFEYSGRIMNGR